MPYFDKRSKKWYAKYYDANGKRKTKGPFSNRRNAELFEFQNKARKELRLINRNPQAIEIEKIFEEYLLHVRRELKPKSAKRDENSINNWRRFLESRNITHLHRLNRKALQDFRQWRETSLTSDISGTLPYMAPEQSFLPLTLAFHFSVFQYFPD